MDSAEDPEFRPPIGPEAGRGHESDRPPPLGLVGLLMRGVVFGLVGLSVIYLLVAAYSGIALNLDAAPRTKVLASSDAADSVASLLVDSELFGPPPRFDLESSNLKSILAGRIRTGRGFSESEGLQGEGTDWYEVELAPGLAEELKANLAKSSLFKPASDFPLPGKSDPAWWPKTWPEGSTCSEYRQMILILPPTGTRLWVQIHRT